MTRVVALLMSLITMIQISRSCLASSIDLGIACSRAELGGAGLIWPTVVQSQLFKCKGSRCKHV